LTNGANIKRKATPPMLLLWENFDALSFYAKTVIFFEGFHIIFKGNNIFFKCLKYRLSEEFDS
jgi:hypothetical protein